jgi:hypothetical protein
MANRSPSPRLESRQGARGGEVWVPASIENHVAFVWKSCGHYVASRASLVMLWICGAQWIDPRNRVDLLDIDDDYAPTETSLLSHFFYQRAADSRARLGKF